MTRSPKVPCHFCKGTGSQKLGAALQKTYQIVKERGPISATDVWRRTSEKLSRTAINKRLNRLLNLGLVKDVSKRGEVSEFEISA